MTDIEIQNKTELKNIIDIAKKINVSENALELYGPYKAKINLDKIENLNEKNDGKLILVTAINPTPYGEGKTTVTIGLGDALNKVGKNAMIALREPSLGPVFGVKGGATGGGYSQVCPMTDINLHFTGDIHAIESANNLMCAALDNHIFQGNELNIDLNNIKIKRCVDMNDRTLRKVQIGRGDNNGVERQDGYDITVASEVMAIFCLAKNIFDLKEKLGDIIVAYNTDGNPVYCRDLKVNGAMCALLTQAIKPNLVQTLENNPCLIHGGPFANIAHGSNSIIATKLALKLSDYVVTEAGFGSDLGAEKFIDIKCRLNNITPSCVVIVATVRALKYNGEGILENGICNLEKHISNMKKFNVPVCVALNKFNDDTEDEINTIKNLCDNMQVPFEISNGYSEGSNGVINLANRVIELCDNYNQSATFIYDVNDSIKNKIEKVAKEIYGAGNIIYLDKANEEIEKLERLNLDKKPICVAKTQMSLSDDAKKLGRPENFDFTISDVKVSNGAGFIVVYTKSIMTMPGLSKNSSYEIIDIDNEGKIIGIF